MRRVSSIIRVAIVGPSGSGNTTISRLLFRSYDPVSAAVCLDGHDLRDVTQASVRAAIGVVPQDTVMFNSTIGYNIGYGRNGASQDDIAAASKWPRLTGSLPVCLMAITRWSGNAG